MNWENLKTKTQILRKNMTDAERALWAYLQKRQISGLKFRRQHVIGAYIVDFVCLSKKLILECDGGQHSMQKKYDFKRDNFLRSQGFRVLRFWNLEVFQNMEGVYAVIQKALET